MISYIVALFVFGVLCHLHISVFDNLCSKLQYLNPSANTDGRLRTI